MGTKGSKESQADKESQSAVISALNDFIAARSNHMTCSFEKWNNLVREKLQFPPRTWLCNGIPYDTCGGGFCYEQTKILSCRYTQKNVYRLNSSNHRHRNNAKSDLVKRLVHHFEYNHIPAAVSTLHHFHVSGVVAGLNSRLLLSLYSFILYKTQFIMVDLAVNKFITTLGDYKGKIHPAAVSTAWSSDLSICVIVVPTDGYFVIDFYHIVERGRSHRFRQISTDHCSHIAFHNAYRYSRILDLESRILKLRDTRSWNILKSVDIHQNNCWPRQVRNLSCSPDGTFILITLTDNICCCRVLPYSQVDIVVLLCDGTSLSLLRSISNYVGTCPIHLCFSQFTPLFSNCSNYLAFVTREYFGSFANLDRVHIVHLPAAPTLKGICRRHIRRYFSEGNRYRRLAIPEMLKIYLDFRPDQD